MSGKTAALAWMAAVACMLPATPARSAPRSFSLFYSYQARPENRAALRAYMDADGVAQFERWKAEGVIKDYTILFATFMNINHVPWDMLVRVDFESYASTDRWKEVERTMPAGLPPRILALAAPENLNVGETLAVHGMAARDASKAVYDVAYYQFKVPLAVGKDFIQGYVMPQLEAFVREGVLAGYGLYLNRYERTDWSYLLLSEYADAATFDLRVENKAKIRSLLTPAWKTLHAIKADHIRDEPHGFIAVRIVPR